MVLGTALLLAGFGSVVYMMTRRSLRAEFDTALQATARTLIAAIEIDAGTIEMDLDPDRMPEFSRTRRPAYFQYRAHDGTSLISSASLGEGDLALSAGAIGQAVLADLALPNGLPGRAVAVAFAPRGGKEDKGGADPGEPEEPKTFGRYEARHRGGEITLVAARDTADMAAALGRLRWVLLGAGAATAALALAMASVVVRRGLGPLNGLASRIAAVREDALADRIPPGPMPLELLPVRERLNDLLSRLEGAFRRERAFAANVAHELRTPLAGVRSTIEVALSRERPADEYRQGLADCLNIAVHMQSMVECLLMLSRLETQQAALGRERIGLSALIDSCREAVAPKARARRLACDSTVAGDLACTGDRECLAVAFANLLDNAVEYADEGGRIEISARRAGPLAEVTVANSGCDLTDEQVSHVFDRFWRSDKARSETGVHCGLGLALVRRTVEALGGTARAVVDPDGTFRVTVSLPAA